MVDFMGENVQELGSVVEEGLVKNNFAASQETRRENFIPWARAKLQLSAMRTQVGSKADREHKNRLRLLWRGRWGSRFGRHRSGGRRRWRSGCLAKEGWIVDLHLNGVLGTAQPFLELLILQLGG